MQTKKLRNRNKPDRRKESSTYTRFYLEIVIMNENMNTMKVIEESQTGIYTVLYKKATIKM